MAYWLLKTEPETYSFTDLLEEGSTVWDGVRNYQARSQLARMRSGDEVIIYHTGKERAAVGRAHIVSEPYPDPTDATGQWLAVSVQGVAGLPRPVPLKTLRGHGAFAGSLLLKAPRLSVVPLTLTLWEAILDLALGQPAGA